MTISCVENRMYLSSEKGHFALNGEAKRWRLMPTARVDDIVLDDPTRPGKKMSVMEWIDAMKFLCGPRF